MHASGGHSWHWRDSHCCDAFECDINDMSWMCQQGWFLTGTEEWHRPVGGFLLCTYWNVVIWNSDQVSCHGDAWLCVGVSCVRCGRLSELNMPHWRFSFYVAHPPSGNAWSRCFFPLKTLWRACFGRVLELETQWKWLFWHRDCWLLLLNSLWQDCDWKAQRHWQEIPHWQTQRAFQFIPLHGIIPINSRWV